MVSRGMKVVGEFKNTKQCNINIHVITGFCSDGEFNSLRSQGYTRPLSIFKIRSTVRSKYARASKQRMRDMLTPICEFLNRLW